MNLTDLASATLLCSECLTEFHPHEGGHCTACGRPLCRVHGGCRSATGLCPHCRRAMHGQRVATGTDEMLRAA
ncbi:MAG: hypothetical protein KDH15_03480 [Rhodocyclaceae bacterium]|nr:hypothetical protein [Rhodocyclaceae bacterium]